MWWDMHSVPIGRVTSQDEWVASLLQYTADAITVVSPAGDLRYFSPASRLLFPPVDSAEAVTSILDLAHPSDADHLRMALTRTSAGHGSEGPIEWRARAGDGTWRNIESTVVSALDDPREERRVGRGGRGGGHRSQGEWLAAGSRFTDTLAFSSAASRARRPDRPVLEVPFERGAPV